ncbi:radical SAM family heme chaperone HemW [Naumannella halotolerans]|uniref:radical SAM family heme chaperone HemW n=1 Tax=Naumannella halotolerans TaxID=993414 RepID=UPI00370D8826
MPSTFPPGEPSPVDGQLPPAALAGLGKRPFGIYLHVPFCRTRCGYCDFNTYTAAELGSEPGASRDTYIDAAIAELDLAVTVLGERPQVESIFVGGGTPTLLPAADLARFVQAVGDRFPIAPGAEVTTESNPESVTEADLEVLAAGGFTRVSFGMQSAVSHVLQVLDRTHTPDRPQQMVAAARRAGIDQVSLDLIYGTPSESLEDWSRSLAAALSAEPDHISAYALIVEEGTALAAQVRRGIVPMPDDDDLADKYLLAERELTAAGYRAYEISNWAIDERARCRHNLGYWRGDDWWGIGPGAHSHVGGVRWWNVKHPRAYAARLGGGRSPAFEREVLTRAERHTERVLLELRTSDGLPLDVLNDRGRRAVPELTRRGLLREEQQRLLLTLDGRLLADAVTRELVD